MTHFTSLPVLNVLGVRDSHRGAEGLWQQRSLVAPAPAAWICPLCHLLTCCNHPVLLLSNTLHQQLCQVVFVQKLNLEIAELT